MWSYSKIKIPGDRIQAQSGALGEPVITRSFRSFLEAYRPDRGVVLNRTLLAQRVVGKTPVRFLPITLFLLNPGKFLE